jgi:hypothetical protein
LFGESHHLNIGLHLRRIAEDRSCVVDVPLLIQRVRDEPIFRRENGDQTRDVSITSGFVC